MRLVFRNQRGAASVEAALSMIIIIPTFMYALFLDDLLRYAADVQETVTSTPWDLTNQDYAHSDEGGTGQDGTSGGLASVQHNARLLYCDHESSGDSYDHAQDCDAENHHNALSGHVCWLNDGAEQVTCDAVDKSVGDFSDSDFGRYKGKFSTGGLYRCHAQAIVENYLMPKTFLQQFSQVEQLSKENWKGKGSIHGNAQSGTDDTAYYLDKQFFAIVTDPMALNYAAGGGDLAVKPGTYSGDVYDRAESVYANNAAAKNVFQEYRTFKQSLKGELLGTIGDEDGSQPNVSLPSGGEVTQSITEDKGSTDYFATPWEDGAGSQHQKTGEARGNHYMGCKEAAGC
ncbi:hypothetical protein [Stigmatella aurantiaca]|uniref:Conserved uncharacterized protein n=1 Tax=Stigmatella aurantiaca (strain DW4/3-1) TaxID=378806 RepID=Q093E5_STIAD|nr:hypothetical protein [Stigmatella aurantiaca]ADO76149.1 conserved uncharacterized protein [Stigmatella aurantiaca DW4/3-1]EAU66856.1 hypothetical protein STIAU_3017 [Stigmatella aurantiaca DW4/3-1]